MSKDIEKLLSSMSMEELNEFLPSYRSMVQSDRVYDIPTDEQIRLCTLGGKMGGKIVVDEKLGVHSSEYKAIRPSSEIGKKSYVTAQKRGVGLASLTKEQRILAGKKGGAISGKMQSTLVHTCPHCGMVSKGLGMLSHIKKCVLQNPDYDLDIFIKDLGRLSYGKLGRKYNRSRNSFANYRKYFTNTQAT